MVCRISPSGRKISTKSSVRSSMVSNRSDSARASTSAVTSSRATITPTTASPGPRWGTTRMRIQPESPDGVWNGTVVLTVCSPSSPDSSRRSSATWCDWATRSRHRSTPRADSASSSRLTRLANTVSLVRSIKTMPTGAASANDSSGPWVSPSDSTCEPSSRLRTCTTTPPRSGSSTRLAPTTSMSCHRSSSSTPRERTTWAARRPGSWSREANASKMMGRSSGWIRSTGWEPRLT